MMRASGRLLGVIAVAGLAGCAEAVLGPDPAADPVTVFDAAWRGFDRFYAFFAHNELDWDAVYREYRPQVHEGSSNADLQRALCGIVAEARSYHASLTYPGGSCGHRNENLPQNYVPELVARTVQMTGRTPSGNITYGRLDGDLAYLRIPSFVGQGWGAEIDQALEAVAGVRGFILDIRNNGGASESVAKDIASRFVDRERVYRLARFRNGPRHDQFTAPKEYRIAPAGRQFAGPVAVLTNRHNGSAAEDFLLMMRTAPNAISVGDTTIGNSSNPLALELPNGWIVRIPQSIQTTPSGEVVEGRGLAPTIPVMLAPADSARGVDTILLRAAEELKRSHLLSASTTIPNGPPRIVRPLDSSTASPTPTPDSYALPRP